MKKFSFFLILSILISSCSSDNKIPDFSSEIDYAYRCIEYSGNPEKDDILCYKYFDKKDKLLEEVGREYRVKFSYNGKGILKEKLSCRMYNCDIGWREIFFYDDNDNYIGSRRIPKNIKSQTPTNFEQTKFYDSNNHLVKELYDRGTSMDGSNWEIWKYYSYQDNRIQSEIQKINGKIDGTGEYKYDIDGNLISITRDNYSKNEIELFQYDKNKKLTKKSIENDELLNDNASFSVHNNSTTYKYDKLGRISQEITFNHRGEEFRRFTYKYENKK